MLEVFRISSESQPFKHQPYKMVKHTQTFGNLPTNCLNLFDHFVELGA